MIVLSVAGQALPHLKTEAGGHRVQRIPPTEKRGRVHTSTVTVAIIEKINGDIKEITENDCEISWFSGSGAGGQHRNKHQNCCRLKHTETGIVESAQCRTRTQSLQQAMDNLRKRIREMRSSTVAAEIAWDRKIQVGSGQRGDKIRTIYMQRDLVVDHRTGKRMTADQYMKGYMDRLWPGDK